MSSLHSSLVRRPIEVPYPYLRDPASLPGNVTLDNWRDHDLNAVRQRIARVQKINEDELVAFDDIYTSWYHAPMQAPCVDKTIKWVIDGQVDIHDVRCTYLPKAAADSLPTDVKKELQAEMERINKMMEEEEAKAEAAAKEEEAKSKK